MTPPVCPYCDGSAHPAFAPDAGLNAAHPVKRVWLCRSCKAWAPRLGGGRVFGRLGTPQVHQLRDAARFNLRALWEPGRAGYPVAELDEAGLGLAAHTMRARCQAWLADELGIPLAYATPAMMALPEMLRDVVALCRGAEPVVIRWRYGHVSADGSSGDEIAPAVEARSA